MIYYRRSVSEECDKEDGTGSTMDQNSQGQTVLEILSVQTFRQRARRTEQSRSRDRLGRVLLHESLSKRPCRTCAPSFPLVAGIRTSSRFPPSSKDSKIMFSCRRRLKRYRRQTMHIKRRRSGLFDLTFFEKSDPTSLLRRHGPEQSKFPAHRSVTTGVAICCQTILGVNLREMKEIKTTLRSAHRSLPLQLRGKKLLKL